MIDDLEMFEVMQAAYPEKFSGDDDATYEAAQEFADSISGWEAVGDLLERLAKIGPVMESPLSGKKYAALLQKTERGCFAMIKREV